MKYITLLVLSLSLILSGCLTCKKAFKMENKLSQIESKLILAAQNPEALPSTCNYMKTDGSEILQASAQLSEQAAMSKFFFTENRCVMQRVVRVCDPFYYGGGPYRRYPHRHRGTFYGGYCHDEIRCAQYKVIQHKLDGYEDALKVASDIRNVDSNVLFACSKVEKNEMLEATIIIQRNAENLRGNIKAEVSTVLAKAQCLKNRD